MLRTIRQTAKSNLRSSLVTALTRFAYKAGRATDVGWSGMAELYRLLLTISAAEGRKGLDAEELAGIERAVLNSGQPELIFLYRRLLADLDADAAKGNKALRILRFPKLSRVRGRAVALVAYCATFSRRITVTSRNDRGGYRPSQTDYLS